MLGEIGGELKYGVISGLTLDLTYNTDFAQVEVDDQQINLDRFSLFFPEKRPFFLENVGAFTVSNRGRRFQRYESDRAVFQSFVLASERRDSRSRFSVARACPGRSRTASRWAVLNMQTESMGQTAANNFTVARVRQDLANRSSIGGLFVNRQATGSLAGIGAGRTSVSQSWKVTGHFFRLYLRLWCPGSGHNRRIL